MVAKKTRSRLRLVAAVLAALITALPVLPAAAGNDPSVSKIAPSVGTYFGGTSVTLTGSGLEGATSVKFGDLDSPSFHVNIDPAGVTDPTITAFSPGRLAPGKVPVTVWLGDRSSSQTSVEFTYVSGGWTPAPEMSNAFTGQGSTRLKDGRVLIDACTSGFGAYDSCFYLTPYASEIYGPLSPGGPVGWRSTGAPHDYRGEHTSTLLADGSVLIAGGRRGDGNPPIDSAEVYDPATAAWTYVETPMVPARFNHGAALLGGPTCSPAPATATLPATPLPDYCGKVLVVGGLGIREEALASTALYDPSSRTWQATSSSLHVARSGHTTTVLPDGKVLVTGGKDGNRQPLRSAEIYDPAADRWTLTTTLQDARYGHRAVLLSNGQVLVTGGVGNNGELKSAEVYDPGSGQWSAAGSMADQRVGHTLTALPDGRALVAGGHRVSDSRNRPLDSAELWDPDAKSWSPTLPLSESRADHSATALLDGGGKVLVAGGTGWQNGSPPGQFPSNAPGQLPLKSAEVFDPRFRPQPSLLTMTTQPTPGEPSRSPATGGGAGGTEVTITGTFLFGAPMSVRFGSTPALKVEPVSDHEIKATSPPGLGTVDVTVTTPGGTTATSGASQFTYLPGGSTSTGGLDACAPATACGARVHQTTVLLDPPACHTAPPPAGYPCGKVLVSGQVGRNFNDGQLMPGDTTLTSMSAKFTPADVGRGISSIDRLTIPPGGHITEYVGPTKVKVSVGHASYATTVGFTIWDSSTELYNPVQGTWSAASPMIGRRAIRDDAQAATFTATLLPDTPGFPIGRVLVAGGCCELVNGRALSSAEIYNPANDTWTPTGAMEEWRVGHTATVLAGPACATESPPTYCGKVLVAGGFDYGDRHLRRSAELYDPALGSWSRSGDLGDARALQSATALEDGDILVVGGLGVDSPVLASAELYHPTDGTWRPVLPLDSKEVLHTATLLDPPFCRGGTPPAGYPCGGVLVVGGAQEFDPRNLTSGEGKKSVALYEPTTGTWSSPSVVNIGRASHTATLLPDGTVLLTGGTARAPDGVATVTQLESVEVYDPVTMISRQIGSMRSGRSSHTATLLNAAPCGNGCGQVLLAGGFEFAVSEHVISKPSDGLATSELFTPAPWAGRLDPGIAPSKGGTPVIISGAALGQADGVRFGTTTVSTHPCPPAPPVGGCFTVRSPTRIDVVTPLHTAGTAEVTATSPLWPAGAGPEGRGAGFTFLRSDAPGTVHDLRAQGLSDTEIKLMFTAAPSDGLLPPPAERYVIRQARTPITDEASFAAATDLCPNACAFNNLADGASLSLTVSGLQGGRTYHYALRALEGTAVGPLSNSVSATTTGPPPICPDLEAPGPGQVAYPAGYSLVGLPAGSLPIASGRYYGWFDQPGGGQYAGRDPSLGAEVGHGYWTWSDCPHLVNLVGPGRDEVSMPLGAYHASLVGNPSATGPVVVSGYDYAARWDPTLRSGAGGYRFSAPKEPLSLAVGEAMWVFSYTATTITMRR